ncbi:MAG: DUF1992 domain-containing protein [Planctomycetales bacterium]|nr:DUF1992 domain-containing protein [Planctomycetales bacterium]
MGARKLDEESWESYAERLIQKAQQDGAFDNLPGFGQPSSLIDSQLTMRCEFRPSRATTRQLV